MSHCPMMPDRRRRMTDDPLLFALLVEEFNAVYMPFLDKSRVNLSDEFRCSVRRTVFDALEHRIMEVTSAEPAADAGDAHAKGTPEFRQWLRDEIRHIFLTFQKAGIFQQLAA
jgi:hypothetical protein